MRQDSTGKTLVGRKWVRKHLQAAIQLWHFHFTIVKYMFTHFLVISDVYEWLTRTGWPPYWPLHMQVQGFHFPWLHSPGWRLTSRMRSFPQTITSVKTEEINKHIKYSCTTCKYCVYCIWTSTERRLLGLLKLTSVNRVVFFSSTPDKNSWLSGRLAPVFSVLCGLMERNIHKNKK